MPAPPHPHKHLLPYSLTTCGLSHCGYVRATNEDAWAELPRDHFFVVADGMGGRQGGEVASQSAIIALSHFVQNEIAQYTHASEEITRALKQQIQQLNFDVWQQAQRDPKLNGMGTTLVSAYFWNHLCIYANVGDSRLYLFRRGKLQQITHDDSLLSDLISFDLISAQEVRSFPLKHVITKAIGPLPDIDPFISSFSVEVGDIILLCSDGLTNCINASTITQILKDAPTLKKAAEQLLTASLEAGGIDNITLILIRIDPHK